MNYYEELGIRQDAPLEEIRQAYKVLARLLHPDSQQDAPLKAMAECQMKRLNEILTILTDPQKRRQYDASLSDSPEAALEWAPPSVPAESWHYQVLHFGLRHWFWVLIGLAVVGVGLWWVEQSTPEAAQVTPRQDAAALQEPGAAAPSGIGQSLPSAGDAIRPPAAHAASTAPHETAASTADRAAVGHGAAVEPPPLEPLRSSPAKELPPPNPVAHTDEPRVTPAPAKLESAGAISKASQVSFAGSWLYAPEAAGKGDPNLYPATYVEFILAEEDGSLVGNYRAKYRIPDQAISPEVQFRAQGKSTNGKSCKLTWTSDDGAQGEAELTLRSSNQMNVTWWTTVFGRRAALSSGMAVLIRQQAP